MNRNSIIFTNAVRFILLALTQIFVLRYVVIADGAWKYFGFYIYPLFIFLLPFNINRIALIFLGFSMGLCVDIFYDTLGMHASAATFTAFIRKRVLQWLEPKGGYNSNFSPTQSRMGSNWFLSYISILLFAHLLFYFSVEAFTFVYALRILQYALGSFVASFGAIMVIQMIFNPVD